MNDLLHYAPLLIVGAILWADYRNGQMIHAANTDRREDHREMMAKLEDIEASLDRLDHLVDGIAHYVAPPIDPENPPY